MVVVVVVVLGCGVRQSVLERVQSVGAIELTMGLEAVGFVVVGDW